MFRRLMVTSSIVILLYSSGVFAQVSAAPSAFDQGKQAFQQGDYQRAVQAFELARKRGEARVALYYNLGVSYFRLGKYDDAKRNFEIVARNKRMAALAHYNLGLVARKQNDRETAISEFRKVGEISKDKKLAALADRNLDELYSYIN